MADTQVTSPMNPTCMESVNRIVKLPVVESSINAATTVYEKVKEYNSVTQWTCNTAESVVNKAVEVGKPIATPIVQGLEGPIKKVDGVFCTGLDYVENKVPAVKLPPGEMYTTTKDYVNNTVTPAIGAAYAYVEPAVKSAYEKIEPAVETAKTVVEPAVEKAKVIVEPAVEKAKTLVEPAIEKAKSIVEPALESLKEYGQQKLAELNQCAQGHPEGDMECEECQAAARNMEEH
ncbi:hypothetical protein Zmor_010502 [Zophobas morio]|uniref:Uncharacterized protein n=1 Tax=Zophobas morio TaxID=2755281 RepID=A0AA38IRX0_9CUCU|nr:hypothetical protein Zmor_010502 [Zophobas morio]